MTVNRRDSGHGEYGESMKPDHKPEADEGLNHFYHRKQRTKESEFATDVDAEPAPPDRDAEYANYKSGRDESFYNYKKWDKYGR